MRTSEILKKFEPRKENILLILHALQDDNAQYHLSANDMREVAKYLKVSRGEVFGIATYYSMFSVTPRGRHIVRVCDSPICHMEGSNEVLEYLRAAIGVGIGETTADGRFTVERTECLGRCGTAPAILIDEDTYTGVTEAKLRSIFGRYA